MNAIKGIEVRPYMVNELSTLYSISEPTMRNWIQSINDKIGERVGRYYNVRQVKEMFDNFGVPFVIEFSDTDPLNF